MVQNLILNLSLDKVQENTYINHILRIQLRIVQFQINSTQSAQSKAPEHHLHQTVTALSENTNTIIYRYAIYIWCGYIYVTFVYKYFLKAKFICLDTMFTFCTSFNYFKLLKMSNQATDTSKLFFYV